MKSSGRYCFSLDNRLNSYTIYDGVEALSPEKVVGLLNSGVHMSGRQPAHYGGGGCSPVDCFENGLIGKEEYAGFCKGNVIKYVVRAGRKPGESAVKDYSKALDYVLLLIKMEENFIYDEEHNINRE